MPPAIVTAGAADLRRTVDDLHAAFMDDPVLSWAFPDEGKRRRYGRHFFEMHARRLVPGGLAWRADGGGALWAAPGRWRESPLEMLRLARATIRGLGTHGARVGRGMLGIESKHPKEPHLYLAVVGVRPEQQGKGLGSALLQPGLAHADRLGLPAYLESSSPRNVPLYERHGFEVKEEAQLPQGPPMWLMWRPASGFLYGHSKTRPTGFEPGTFGFVGRRAAIAARRWAGCVQERNRGALSKSGRRQSVSSG
ncbi:MAG TPA: GNAT family N-acetyltransferase [Solirubrobacterales bacterium]|nr:GNAT family N-acetyltransferase [Solirubrobacterales bacterium]